MGQPFTQIARMYVCSRREFIAGHTALLVKGLVESESVAHTDHRYTRGTTKVIEHLPDELIQPAFIDVHRIIPLIIC